MLLRQISSFNTLLAVNNFTYNKEKLSESEKSVSDNGNSSDPKGEN